MWVRRSNVLAPLASLTTKSIQPNEKDIKSRNITSVSNFSKPFDVYTDASNKLLLGAVICQENGPIVCYSRKLNPVQTCYTPTDRELLAIVETLKEFWNI
jgi:RNase H-like domain found in reverse transcriptase